MENLSLSDEDAAITRDSQNLRNQRGGGGGLREEKEEHKTACPRSCSIESYRDPSLHKTSIEKHQYVRQKNASIHSKSKRINEIE